MLSYRPFYSPELDYCRRSERGLPLQLVHGSKIRAPYESSDISGNRESPPSDSETKSGCPVRKRVPVACGRCRKRKIKCSGDDGNGACSNCRNAGAVHQCQFLRVNSLSQEILSQPSSRWQMGVRYSPYAVSQQVGRQNSFTNSLTFSHPHTASGQYSGMQSSYDYNTYNPTQQSTTWARNSNLATYSYSCDEEPPLSYSGHPTYLLPNAESSMNNNSGLGSPAGLRTWGPTTHMSRSQCATAYTDQPVTSSTAPLGNHFLSYNQLSTNLPSESAFPGLLSSNTNSMTNDRLLPDPAASRSQSASKITSIESVPMNLLHRNSNSWMEPLPGSSHSTSGRTLSIGLSDISDNTSRSTTALAPQDISYGFVSLSNGPQEGSIQSIAVETAAETSQSAFDYSKVSPVGFSKDRCRPLSCGSVASLSEEGTTELYGYSSENRSGRHSAHPSTSSGQLSDGKEYTRLRHESSHFDSVLEEHRQHSSPYQTNLPHRASIALSSKDSSGY